ncbi:MAG TPA: FAD binding domain-containing protein [Syntrophorhabdaceae bacterium]|nr:FAD binding domain-containing protein [Syntrophorhabdaceae bacterium]HPU29788.1 FAD binding domain-containing protein [Syntrophorhabdaceae bacterium]
MILPKFDYKKARTIEEALELYNKHDGNAFYLAGGTDLVPLIKLRLLQPKVIIDLKGIDGLKDIKKMNNSLVVGPNITLFELKQNPFIKDYFPCLFESLEATSCETLQMRGTIGGNILQNTRCLQYNKSLEWRTARGFCLKMGGKVCNVVPNSKSCFSNYCGDNAPSLMTIDAKAKLVSAKGERTVRLEKLFSEDGRSPFTIKPGEILKEIIIPLKKTKGAYEKLTVRGSIDYPLVGVAVTVKKDAAVVAVTGIGPSPHLYEIKEINEKSINEVADWAYEDARPVLNAVLTPLYRKKMVPVLIKRAFKRIGAGGGR